MQYFQKYSRSKLKLKISYRVKLLKFKNFIFGKITEIEEFQFWPKIFAICILKKDLTLNTNEQLHTLCWTHKDVVPTLELQS